MKGNSSSCMDSYRIVIKKKSGKVHRAAWQMYYGDTPLAKAARLIAALEWPLSISEGFLQPRLIQGNPNSVFTRIHNMTACSMT